MDTDTVGKVALTLITWTLLAAHAAYMYFLRAPSAVEVRPELAEVGFWTAAFSGRFSSWIWYNEPMLGVVYTAFMGLLIALIFWLLW